MEEGRTEGKRREEERIKDEFRNIKGQESND